MITYNYDRLGRQTGAKNGAQPVSSTEYNVLGWVLKETDFDGVVKTHGYDAAGRKVSETIGGLTTTTSFDGLGRQVRKSNPDGSSIDMVYDVFGRVTSLAQVGTDGTWSRTETVVYDQAGRPVKTERGGRTVETSYGTDGAITVVESRGSNISTATYDATGLLRDVDARLAAKVLDWSVTATDNAGRVTDATSTGFSFDWRVAYDQAGRLVSGHESATYTASASGGEFGTAGIPPRGGPKGTGGAEAVDTYSYDPSTGKKNHDSFVFYFPDKSQESTYTYDLTGRLRSVVGSNAAAYAYDPTSGALTGYERGTEASVALGYDSQGRLTSLGARTMTYNSRGQRIGENLVGNHPDAGVTEYQWLGERLASLSLPDRSASYVYDASGQRVRSVITSGSITTTTTWDYDGLRLLGYSASRSNGATYALDYLYDERGVVFAGVYSASDASSTPFLLVTTDRGDVRELLDASGDSFAYYEYDAYGNPMVTSTRQTSGESTVTAALAAAIAERQVLRYASYAFDAHSGLYYCSQRYYDPRSAAFISKDPAKADGEEGAYQYCAGEPVGSVDPSGLWLVRIGGFSMWTRSYWVGGRTVVLASVKIPGWLAREVCRANPYWRKFENKIRQTYWKWVVEAAAGTVAGFAFMAGPGMVELAFLGYQLYGTRQNSSTFRSLASTMRSYYHSAVAWEKGKSHYTSARYHKLS